MSLILDALNRADQERSQENNAPILSSSPVTPPQSSRPIRRWLIEGVIIFLAILIFVYSLFFHSSPAQESVITGKNIEANNAARQTPVKPIADSKRSIKPKPPADKSSNIQQATTVAAEKPTVLKTTQSNISTKKVKPPATNTAIASLYQQQTDSSTDEKLAAPKTKLQTITTTSSQPIDNGQSILQKIPLLVQMSSRFQQSVPTIDYSVHVYSDSENAGFVNLNGSIRKIGSKIAPGLVVIAILKDSVVLDYNGTQFRLLALNSWMNFN